MSTPNLEKLKEEIAQEMIVSLNRMKVESGYVFDFDALVGKYIDRAYNLGRNDAVEFIEKKYREARQATFSGENEVHDFIDDLLHEATQGKEE